MNTQPTLRTQRLTLRPLDITDAAIVQRLAGDRDVALKTTNIPYPYDDGVAEQWISSLGDQFAAGTLYAFGIVVRATENSAGGLIGVVGLMVEPEQEIAELGYWVGKPYWKNGYCSEAARAVLGFGFEQLELRRIHARYFAGNSASGRVMLKIGMTHEGTLRQHVKRDDVVHDLVAYGILRNEYCTNKKVL